MTYSLTWLADVLRAAGLNVVEQPGWKTRGHGDMGKVVGVLCHHTAGALKGNAPSLKIVQSGRPDLKGPLAQLVLGRDGTYYVVAAGLCYHAGAGNWRGVKTGNKSLIGIEAENTGLANDPWPTVQMDAYVRGVAALLKHIGAEPIMAVGHLEYALPVGRKSDPSFSTGTRNARIRAMEAFRERIAAIMRDDAPSEAPGDAHDDDDSEDETAAEPSKPLVKSKIAQASGGFGIYGGSEVVSGANEAVGQIKQLKDGAEDIGLFELGTQFLSNPKVLWGLAIIVTAGLIIYWRWRDHS